VPRKTKKWAVAPRAGPHKKFESIPLQVVARDILKLVETGKDAKTIIHRGEILIDGKKRKDHAFPVGLFDVISIPKINSFYRVVPSSKGLLVVKIPEKESNEKICKIDNKTIVRKGKLQLNLHDGKNILAGDKKFKTGDSVLLELPTLKIKEHVPLASGSIGIVARGTDSGKIGKVKDVVVTRNMEPTKIICEIEGKQEEVLKERFFVIGTSKPLITVSE